ncbi:MAG: hydantoinase/oxoprolinase family protein [Burkholderiaceae bacterium]|nr:hydantoinase/oxoprolinase family protein [Burkholderiaceae bacterium]
MGARARLAVDIGGTFTDLALDVGGRRVSAKVLTTPRAPEEGVLNGIATILAKAQLTPADIDVLVHGTTLATNAIIERKGAKTALVCTEGFRDSIEMAFENRFEQYDILMDKPPPLVARPLRLSVPERMDARGNEIEPLDEAALGRIADQLAAEKVESVAIGFLHSYAWPAHEQRARDILKARLPHLWITLSSDVSPEIREYERWSTAVANAYVQPVMAGYLGRLKAALATQGFACPVFLITSAGGLTTLETASMFPIRLVESGPAGGAILASQLAQQCGYDEVLSFDMGGTTAKVCLIDDGEPQYSRTFEVARAYRFMKGSGLPLRIPVVEMVEIGAGGGSIASVDAMKRIQVGPESAASEPGPACYDRGGTQPTVTDADMVLGAIDPARFAGGTIALDPSKSARAMDDVIGARLGFTPEQSAYGIVEVVEENMANAARVHAVERGKELAGRTMIAFGGAAPLHAARLAEKLDIARVLVPTGAGVGSAVGFLLAPVAFEVVRTRYTALSQLAEPSAINAMREEMRSTARDFIRAGEPTAELTEVWTADMRYAGQGHDLTVRIPGDAFGAAAPEQLRAAYEAEYERVFGITIPGMQVEITSWALRMAAATPPPEPCPPTPATREQATPAGERPMFDAATGERRPVPLYWRFGLAPGVAIPGPAIIAEEETSTLVTAGFTATINALGYIVMERKGATS